MIIIKRSRKRAEAGGEVNESSKEPVSTARCKIEHRCGGERKRVMGDPGPPSFNAKGARLGCDDA
jgi:hypothetical protein